MAGQSSIFLRLPLEIREEIYLQLLLFRDDVGVQSLTPKLDRWIKSMWDDPGSAFCDDDENDTVLRGRTSILCVSKQVSEEALDVLYQRNTFVTHTHADSHDKFLKFGTANILRIRSLRLVTHPHELGYMEPVKFDPKIWCPLLKDLTHLSLVLKQPWKAREHYDSSGSKEFRNYVEEDLRKWLVWLEPILQYFATNISDRTTVSIDDNELAETSEIVHKCFRAGYQRVQTEIGDVIFERALPSEESDYWYDDYDMDSTCGGTINDSSD
ncbi:hypothetical protein F5Y00DRAFT_246510 [Daldinia vernicosa]|uniref:uncharacterized protein n=1 Tax=Daldinia vernicosa TaxID=114800 RepID=UPI0020071E73|nr:uncharacterized protein F5Y00DRAFT_246510 [Daldinia vernicosa]KAI0845415.1 hypothetical protein F5Y00DRAFT_246510 [Daldinia vernicosa]